MAIPEEKHQEIVERLNAFANSGERGEFALRALERDIKTLHKADPVRGFTLRGMLASNLGDEPGTRENFQSARRLEPKNWWIEFNFGRALFNLGYPKEAREQAERVYQADPSNILSLDEWIVQVIFSGRALEASNKLKERTRLSPERNHRDSALIEELAEFFKFHELRDDDVEDVFVLTLNVLREQGGHRIATTFSVSQDEESEWVSGEVSLAESVNTVVDLNEKLAEAWAESEVAAKVGDLVNFMFVPAEV